VSGKAPVRQRCADGDSGCDADVVAGACTFTVAVCLGHDDARLGRCRRVPIESVRLLVPPPEDDLGGRVLAALAALGPSSLAGGTVTYAPPLTVAERCTGPVAISVPTRRRRPGALVLRMRTTGAGGRPRDADTLRLVCIP
jgi:hypothetical protein